MPLLETRSLQKYYGGVRALEDGNLYCDKGKVCGLLGANGSGKSTFSKIISGIVRPSSGEIFIDGVPVTIKSPLDAKKNGIIMVHQHLSLIPELTVWENMTLGHEPADKAGFLKNEESRKIALEYFNTFCPDVSVYSKVKDLALSQKQFVEIAKAISQNPRLLILDEPTAPLEQTEVDRLFKAIAETKAKGTAIIFISHRLWEVKAICDYVVVFRNGRTVGTINFEAEHKDEKRIVSMITGDENSDTKHRDKSTISETAERVIEVKGLSLKKSLKNINFSVNRGEIIGISGLQGQGQEEIMLVLSGLIQPDQGSIVMEGKQLQFKHPKDAINNGIVLVPGDRHKEGLFLQHNVLFNLILPQLLAKKSNFFLRMTKLNTIAQRIVEKVNIHPPNKKHLVQFLSGGNQQKIVVGKWLPMQPKVLLLSDPAKGVDVQAKKELYNIVTDLASRGTTVVLYASDNEELISVCNRVLIMFEGEIVEEIPQHELNDDRLVAASLRSEESLGVHK
ncbi:MAG: sugar ABC transporter ATP-binding protein [Bacilli bacterium]